MFAIRFAATLFAVALLAGLVMPASAQEAPSADLALVGEYRAHYIGRETGRSMRIDLEIRSVGPDGAIVMLYQNWCGGEIRVDVAVTGDEVIISHPRRAPCDARRWSFSRVGSMLVGTIPTSGGPVEIRFKKK